MGSKKNKKEPGDAASRFAHLDFDGFRALAREESLSKYEKIGFPDSYREGKEKLIFKDILSKLENLNKENQVIMDIGPGCSELPLLLLDLAEKHHHRLILIDSQEMLDLLPDRPFIEKIPARYPEDCLWLFDQYREKIDAILCYSVFHYIFDEGNTWKFLDFSLSLMGEGGEMLIGDIPNISKRKRFFSSRNGIEFHQKFMQTEEKPDVKFNTIEIGKIDDAVILSVMQRSRAAGFDAYCIPQDPQCPMANRREDILIRKP